MPDGFLLLAPLLLIPIVLLVRFVGCYWWMDLYIPPLGISLSPTSVRLGPGESQTFTIVGPATTSQSWSADAGQIDQTGRYTAPNPFDPSVTSATVVADATATEDGTNRMVRAIAAVRLQAAQLTISDPIPLKPGETFQFTHNVSGLVDQRVTWSSNPAGLIDVNTGLFTAPSPFLLATKQATVTAVSQVANAVTSQVTVRLIGNGARFLRKDVTTHGTWIPNPVNPTYGKIGYSLANGVGAAARKIESLPLPKLAVTFTGEQAFSYAPRGDGRDLTNPEGNPAVLSSLWYPILMMTQFTIDIEFHDFDPHQIAIYFVMWDGQPRTQTIHIVDGDDTMRELDRQTIDAFDLGQYLVWEASGHVIVQVELVTGVNPVASAIFFD